MWGPSRRSGLRLLRGAASALLLLFLSLPGCCDLEIVTDDLPPGKVGEPYRFELESECGSGYWSLSAGSLPPGISLNSEGELSGTPSTAGTFLFTVKLDDFSGEVIFKGFAMEVPGRDAVARMSEGEKFLTFLDEN